MTELYEPEVADLPKPDVVESVKSGADGGDTGVSTTLYTAEGVEEEEGEMPTDFERLWKHTSDNPQDFNSWTDLLQYCEQEVNGLKTDYIALLLGRHQNVLCFSFHYLQGHMRASRQALNAFLVRYPLCYGYWKKFADLERQAGHNDKAEEVRTCIDGQFSYCIKIQKNKSNLKAEKNSSVMVVMLLY